LVVGLESDQVLAEVLAEIVAEVLERTGKAGPSREFAMGPVGLEPTANGL
jgi:hypothetical protein